MGIDRQVNIEIDKLTKSIENVITGDSFKTEVLAVSKKDIKQMKETEWLFNWQDEGKDKKRSIYKLVILDNPNVIQGLVSLQDKSDHIFMHLIESNKFNRGARKMYLGVPGNLIAFACKLSFDYGYDGFISFESKTNLISHYRQSLGAELLFGNFMVINTKAASKLVKQYFP